MKTIAHQPELRPALPFISACQDYHQQRDLIIRIDKILTVSGLEVEFVALSMRQHGFDPASHTPKKIDTFTRASLLALRSNIARHLIGAEHREFCVRIAESHLLQWFLLIGRVDGVNTFALSTSDRFSHWLDEASLRIITPRLTGLLAGTGSDGPVSALDLGL